MSTKKQFSEYSLLLPFSFPYWSKLKKNCGVGDSEVYQLGLAGFEILNKNI